MGFYLLLLTPMKEEIDDTGKHSNENIATVKAIKVSIVIPNRDKRGERGPDNLIIVASWFGGRRSALRS